MNTPQRKFWWEAKLSLLTALESAHRVTRSQLACEATKIVLLALNERVFVSENLVCYRGEHDNFNLERLFFFYSTSCNQYFELLRCSLVHMSYVWLMRDAIAGTRNRELRKEKKRWSVSSETEFCFTGITFLKWKRIKCFSLLLSEIFFFQR